MLLWHTLIEASFQEHATPMAFQIFIVALAYKHFTPPCGVGIG
jgi:hypothetical protein